MANAVLEGARQKGADAALYTPDSFDASMIEEQDAIAFGCPSMGCEELRIQNLSLCFHPAVKNLEERKWLSLAHTDGAMENGCGLGGNLPGSGSGTFVCESVICK